VFGSEKGSHSDRTDVVFDTYNYKENSIKNSLRSLWGEETGYEFARYRSYTDEPSHDQS